MKMKKLLAIVLSAAMVTTSITVPTGPGDTVMAATADSVTTGDWMSANSGLESLEGDFDVTYTYHEKGGEFGNAGVIEVRDNSHYIDFRSDYWGAIGTLADGSWTPVDFTDEQKRIAYWPTSNVNKGNQYGLTITDNTIDPWALLKAVRSSSTGVEASAHVVRTGNKIIVDIAERDASDLELLAVWHYEVVVELENATTITLSAGANCELTNISFKRNITGTADTAAGIVGYYPLDDSLLNLVSASEGTAKIHGGAGDTWNSPATGTEAYTEGKKNQAYSFAGDTGVDTSLKRGEGLELDTLMPKKEWTVSFWAKPDQITDATSMLFAIKGEDTGGLSIADQWFNTSFPSVRFWKKKDPILLENWTNAAEGTNTSKLNQWTYITLTNDDDGMMTLYMDGEKESSSYAWKTDAVANCSIMLGINWWDASYKGLLDEVTIYDRALSAADVSQLYKDDGTPDLSATAVTLDKTSVSLTTDGELELKATVEPFYSTDKVIWTTSNSNIVDVTDGKLTAKGIGPATITATAGKVSATCEVTVSGEAVPITELTLSSDKQILSATGSEQTAQLSFTYEPKNATNMSEVHYSSTNESVLKVSDNGKITAVGKGTASVSASVGEVESNKVEFNVYDSFASTNGWWNGTHLCETDFPADGQAVQYDVLCTAMGNDGTADVAFFVMESSSGDKYIDLSSYNDAWGAGATDYKCSRTSPDYSSLISAGDSVTVTVNRIGKELEAIFYNNTKNTEFQRITATVKDDFVNGKLYFYPQYGSYFVSAVSHALVKDEANSTAATCTTDGQDVYKCTDDDYVYNKKLPAKGHTMAVTAAKDATCTEPGNSAYWHCSACNLYYDNEAGTGTGAANADGFTIPAKGHNYTSKFSWTETPEGKYTATAVLTCANAPSHTVNLTAEVTSETTDATYEAEGETVYTAKVTHDGKDYTDTKTVTIPKLTDNVKPDASVTIGTSVWKELLNTITFGLLFKETQTVTVEASDAGIGLDSVAYILASKQMTLDQLEADAATWTAFDSFMGTATVSLNPSKKYVVYVKAVDKAGNVTYVSSDGMVVDDTVPVIEGVENGKTYCKAQTITVTDNLGLKSVTVNGKEVTLDENKYTVSPAAGAQEIVALDTVGNSTTIKITVNNSHEYNDPEFFWTENEDGNNFTAKAVFTCKHCEDKQEVEAAVERTSTTATCIKDGTTTYTATVSFGGTNYTDTKDAPSKALGHDYKEESSDATCTTPGTVICTCKRCGYVETKSGVKLSHKLTKTEPKNPTCTEAGTKAYWTCSECHNLFSDDSGKDESMTTMDQLVIPAIGHKYDSVKFTWSQDKTTATAVAVCANDASHTEQIADVAMTQQDTTPATCTDDGEITYTATAVYGGKNYTESKVVTIPATGHDYEAVFTWTDDNKCTAVLKCKKNDSTITADQLSCTVGEPTVKPASCETAGSTTYTATVTYNGKTYIDQKEIAIPATGHKYDSVGFTWSDDNTTATAVAVCANDASHTEEIADVTVTHQDTTAATCTNDGKRTYTATVSYGGKTYTDQKEVSIPATGHKYDSVRFTWSDDNTTATAVAVCANDPDHTLDMESYNEQYHNKGAGLHGCRNKDIYGNGYL